MKKFLLDLINYILSLLNKEREPIIDDLEATTEPTEVNVLEEPEQVVEEPKQVLNEVYEMLSLKDRQTYLKKIGLYTSKIDGIIGSGSKRAIKQFNIIYLNKKSDTYYEDTDKLLRVIYASYCDSPYMNDSDWKYYKNFKISELQCTCKGKYCNKFNGLRNKIPMHLLMTMQYKRNYYGKAVSISSCVRCTKRNAEVGGVKNSKHIQFKAFDSKSGTTKASDVVSMIYKNSNTKLPFVHYSYAINAYYAHIDITV